MSSNSAKLAASLPVLTNKNLQMERITEKQLNNLVKKISDLTGIANNREDAKKAGKNGFLHLENAPIYGGYRLIRVSTENGSHHGIFGLSGTEARKTPKEMYNFLSGLIIGFENAEWIVQKG